MFFIHPDDIETPRTGTWADDFNTFEEACIYYGVDTPAQIAAEIEWDNQQGWIMDQDELEANGPRVKRSVYPLPYDPDSDCPF